METQVMCHVKTLCKRWILHRRLFKLTLTVGVIWIIYKHIPPNLLSGASTQSVSSQDINIETSTTKYLPESADVQSNGSHLQPKEEHIGGTYTFISPPYKNHSQQEITVLRDVCLEPRSIGSGKTQIVVYNSDHHRETRGQVVVHGYHPEFNVSWPVVHRPDPPPPHFTMMPSPAFFIIQNMPGNLFHFFEEGTRGLFALLEVTGRLGDPNGNHLVILDCDVADDTADNLRYREILLRLSPGLQYLGCHHRARGIGAGVCFPHGVFGHIRRTRLEDRDRFYNHTLSVMGVSPTSCRPPEELREAPTIVFVDRAARRIDNLPALVAATQQSLPSGARVSVVRWENMTLREQMATVHCTNILVGVHGSGLHWLQLLPPEAGVIEVGWKRWPPGMYYGLAKQRGLAANMLTCDNVSFDWHQYAKANRLHVNLSSAERAKVMAGTEDCPHRWDDCNPYKFGVGVVPVAELVAKIHTMMGTISRRWGLHWMRNS